MRTKSLNYSGQPRALKQAEREAKENQLKVIDNRMDELSKYRLQVQDELKALSPAEDSKDG